MIIVYDFDKTLTYTDTLFSFFRHCSKKDIFYILKLIAYFCIMLTTKFKFTSNNTLKQVGIRLFLYNKTRMEIQKLSKLFSSKIKFNRLYKELDFDKSNEYYVISASFVEYLVPLFPKNVKVIGSKLLYHDDLVKGLKFNCYKENKLRNLNLDKIDIFYTDSLSDYPLAKISKKTYIVDEDKMTLCIGIDKFLEYFNK